MARSFLPPVGGSFQERAAQHSGMAINTRRSMDPHKMEEEEVVKTVGGTIASTAGGVAAGAGTAYALGASTPWGAVIGGLAMGLGYLLDR